MATVYLGLGSNLGDRVANIEKALRLLESHVRLRRVSSLYETEPWGLKAQPWFLNATCSGETDRSPRRLLDFVKAIEWQIGRRPTVRWGPRLIDIDILFYDDLVIETPDLRIPHPRLAGRGFVLVPLAEIAPDLAHPVTGITVTEMLAKLEGLETVRRYPDRSWDVTRTEIHGAKGNEKEL